MMNKVIWVINVVFTLVMLAACGGSGGGDNDMEAPANPIEELEAQLRDSLDTLVTDTDFTLLVTAKNGRVFSHSTGTSSATTSYRSASTSKWVTAAVILDLVKEGFLSLDDNPQNFINTWPTTGNHSQIELRPLLIFTSVLTNEPACLFPGQVIKIADCVDNCLNSNPNPPLPGTEFAYSSSHMQVAGLMAIRALNVTSWGEVFNNFKATTSLFTDAVYDLPGTINPRLAGGMHWTAEEYLEFLQALFDGTILTSDLIDEMTGDQLQGVTIVASPAQAAGEDWHYGYGNWIECHAPVFNCSAVTKTSSPGAYGAYPFIDWEFEYFGIWAREGALGSFEEGYDSFTQVEMQLQLWAELNQN